MDSKTRKELKADHFVEEVGHGVEYVTSHKNLVIRMGVVVAILLAVGGGAYAYWQSQKSARMELLGKAYLIQDAPVGEPTADFKPLYKTPSERQAAAKKAFEEVASKHGSTEEGYIAKYFLGAYAANDAKWAEAEKYFLEAGSKGSAETASLANFALAQVYAAQNKKAEAEKLLRGLIAQPSVLVSKEQAEIALGRMLMASNPAEAKKILEPLRAGRSPVSRAAIAALAGAN